MPNRSVVVVVGSSESLKSQERKKREKTERRIVKNHVTFAEFGFA